MLLFRCMSKGTIQFQWQQKLDIMQRSRIQYNPRLSIQENAVKNGVSEDAIRYYIRTRKIDRRYERKVNIVNEIRAYLKVHPNATKDETSRALKHGINTIRDYWEVAKGNEELPSVFAKEKKPKTDIRELHDFYATHPSATRDILRVEEFGNKILEPFCGTGTMAEVIKQSGRKVLAYDLIDRGYKDGKIGDFFEIEVSKNQYDIITNPPYNEDIPKIIKRCVELAKNKVAIIMPLRYLSSKARYTELYAFLPPSRVYVYMERIKMAKDGNFEKYADAGASKEIYAWFVWEKGYAGETILKWLANEKE